MNLKTVVTLADGTVTTVSCKLKTNDNSTPKAGQYTFKCKKVLAQALVPGDVVLVDTIYGIKTATVVKVHEESQIEPDDGIEYRWLFDRVLMYLLAELTNAEDLVLRQAQIARREVMRSQMRELLAGSNALPTIEG